MPRRNHSLYAGVLLCLLVSIAGFSISSRAAELSEARTRAAYAKLAAHGAGTLTDSQAERKYTQLVAAYKVAGGQITA